MYKLITTLSACFFIFISWIIYLANTGQNSIFFELVAAIPYGDKVGHFCLFGLLTLGANFALKLKEFELKFIQLYAGSTLVFLFVLVEELSQYFIPSRTLDASDLLADIAGILVFNFMTKVFSKLMNKHAGA